MRSACGLPVSRGSIDSGEHNLYGQRIHGAGGLPVNKESVGSETSEQNFKVCFFSMGS